MKIRTRLLIFNMAALLVTIATLGSTFFLFGERYLHQLAIDQFSRSTRQALIFVDKFFDARLAEQKTLSTSTFFFRKLDHAQIQTRFQAYRHYYRAYQRMSFLDSKGVRKIDLNGLDLEKPTDFPDLLSAAKQSDRPVYRFNVANPLRPTLHFMSAVKQGSTIIGFVEATVPLATLQKYLQTMSQPITGPNQFEVELTTRDGSRITPNGGSEQNSSPATATLGEGVSLDDGGTLFESPDEFRIVYDRAMPQQPNNSWKLAFRIEKGDLERPIHLLHKMMIAIFAALILLAIALNRWLTQSLLLPIERLTASMESYNLGQTDTTIADKERNDEIGVLSRGVHDLTERLKIKFAELSTTSKFVALGEMAAGIAHEINNPLTVIMGKASLLDRPDENLDKTLVRDSAVKIMEMVRRITRTVYALRVYARSGEHDPVGVESVQSILNSTLDICLERMRLASIRVDVIVEPPDAVVIARPVQISQILMNLLNNAHDSIMSHSEVNPNLDPSEKWIRIHVHETEEHVCVTVDNGGPRISDDVAPRLFEPFFTTKPSGIGTGLGLIISRRLAIANRATLRYAPEHPFTRFILDFPRPDLELLRPVSV